jgi:glycosyltransferase involved in cell wall biosynthesis
VPAPLLLDLSHTSHTRARTGIQRVGRSLRRALAARALTVCFDPYLGAWRPLEAFEEENLASSRPAPGRRARWPLWVRFRGRLRRLRSGTGPLAVTPGAFTGVLVPEIFSPEVSRALPQLFQASKGPRVALFHDAIVLQYPELSPRRSVGRFPGYLRELLQFDGVAAISEASKACLLEYWRWLGVSRIPKLTAIPLGIDPAADVTPSGTPSGPPTILSVGSIEARKNHIALLDACESLWARGLEFRLRLIGMANAETGRPALRRIEELKSSGRPLRYSGPEDEACLAEAYRECTFTVYPSLAEGFGFPVAESLSRGKPCLCRMDGALGEIARDGGCLGLGSAGSQEIAAAIAALLESPSKLAPLEEAARARRFKGWTDYAGELLDWMQSLGRQP